MITNQQISEQIIEVLETLKPYFYMHGGDITFVGFVDGQVQVRLRGSCQGCSASSYTLKLLVEQSLKQEVPQVTEVVEIE